MPPPEKRPPPSLGMTRILRTPSYDPQNTMLPLNPLLPAVLYTGFNKPSTISLKVRDDSIKVNIVDITGVGHKFISQLNDFGCSLVILTFKGEKVKKQTHLMLNSSDVSALAYALLTEKSLKEPFFLLSNSAAPTSAT